MNTKQCLGTLAAASMFAVLGCGGDTEETTPDSGSPDTNSARCINSSDDLIADFEMDNGLKPLDGRQGGFYVYSDESGSFEPPKVGNDPYPIDSQVGGPCSGKGSFHTKATGFAKWGAAVGTDFVPQVDGVKGWYDASAYKGISFWAKAAAPITGVQVSFPDIYTDGGADPTTIDANASKCAYVAGSTINCSPYLVKFGNSDFPAYEASQITDEWKRFDVLFDDTKQDRYNPGLHREEDKIDVSHLTSMAIQVNAVYVNGSPTPNDFEIWVDDIYFIK